MIIPGFPSWASDRHQVEANEPFQLIMESSAHLRIHALAFWTFSVGAVLVLVLWGGSYFGGYKYYRSNWFQTETASREKAQWLMSNFGSLGVARRTQEVIPPMDEVPEPERLLEKGPRQGAAATNIHPGGFRAWHWFNYHSATTPRGASSSTYSHLFIPYWCLFLILLAVAAVAHRRANSTIS